ncbi:MAG TPA: hypothetical protein PLI05_03505 [Methanotrichaceae archaeon]|nr:hypothetical protein [Methanotrichaceae archaeon]HQF16118.1 hypothetical protein [Methanotrichaceae archaeon]HQI90768.1 hypothetical protein [Methanotrichaceae archaeon]HQJ28276.1 hypothetical protein [Methanotrichaceae archaeon]
MALRLWILLCFAMLASSGVMALADNTSHDPSQQGLASSGDGQAQTTGGNGTYRLEAGEWNVALQGPPGLETRAEWQAGDGAGDGFYTLWLLDSAESYATIFIVEYAGPVTFGPEALRGGLDQLLSPYHPVQVLSALRTVDGSWGAVAEAFSQSLNRTVYAMLYPIGAGQDNSSSVTAGLVSLLDREASMQMIDTLHIQNGQAKPDKPVLDPPSRPSFAPQGSREEPVPLGTPVDLVDGWEIRVIRVIPNATEMVMTTDPGNDPPRPGYQYFIASIEGRYHGSASSILDPGLRLRALGRSEIPYRSFDRLVAIPDPLPRTESFSGALVTGNVCWEVRSSDADLLVMFDHASRDSRIYMALYR